LVERSERHEILDFRHAVVGALAETNGAELRQRTHRFAETFLHGFDAGHECGGDGADAGNQDA
jgi:hypothetical protein